MPKLVLGTALARWMPQSGGSTTTPFETQIDGISVGDVFAKLFERYPNLRGYVVDEQGVVRHHVAVFVNGISITDKRDLSAVVGEGGEVCIMQALSGG